MKKLVFFIGGLKFGGMERVVFIAQELLKNDFDIKIVTLYQDSAEYDVKKEYYNLDVKPSKYRLITFFKRLIRTIKMKKDLKPDYVFSFGMYLNYLNTLSSFFTSKKIKTIAGIRSYDWLTEPFVSSKIDKWIMNKMDKINSVSKLIAEDSQKYWGIPLEKNDVIYNPYDVDDISKKSLEEVDDYTFEDDKYYLITMGRLSDQKAFNNLVRSMDLVLKKYKNIELLILGSGDKYDQIINMIKEYQLEKNIKLLGGKKNPYKYVKRADLYVMSSLTEGFPNALSEAMCIGTPIVSVNCKSGPAEILTGKTSVDFGNDELYIGEYGVLSKEMIPDKKYIKLDASASEISLASAICYAYEHKEEMQKKAQKAKEHMKQFSYQRFKNDLIEILK